MTAIKVKPIRLLDPRKEHRNIVLKKVNIKKSWNLYEPGKEQRNVESDDISYGLTGKA